MQKLICSDKQCKNEKPDDGYKMCQGCRDYYRSLKPPSKMKVAQDRIKELELEIKQLKEKYNDKSTNN